MEPRRREYNRDEISAIKAQIRWYYETYYPDERIVATDIFFTVLSNEINDFSKTPEADKDAVSSLYIRNLLNDYVTPEKRAIKRMDAIVNYLDWLQANPTEKKVHTNRKKVIKNDIPIPQPNNEEIPQPPAKPQRGLIYVLSFVLLLIVAFIAFKGKNESTSNEPISPGTDDTSSVNPLDSTQIAKRQKATNLLASVLEHTYSAYRHDSLSIYDCLALGADVNAQARNGRTILHVAAMLNDTTLAKIALKDSSVNVNIIDNMFHVPPIWYAARFNSLNVAKLLLNHGNNLLNVPGNGKNTWNATALDVATDTAMIRLLSNHGALTAKQLSIPSDGQ
ncbi:MAG: ankyrin repeat domain-containing protein [Flavipsychrobacter sp.]|nr:ankyrin repeat domain-containing protein [Flavipsychrobacter sp.]